jgi:hypothetical protein
MKRVNLRSMVNTYVNITMYPPYNFYMLNFFLNHNVKRKYASTTKNKIRLREGFAS